MSKICNKCNIAKKESAFRNGRNGCKECYNKANRERYKRNPDKYRAKAKKLRDSWSEGQRKEFYAKRKKHLEANPGIVKEYNRRYYERHIDKIKEYGKEYHKKNAKNIIARVKRWVEENRDKKNQYHRNFYKRHRKEILGRQKERLQTDPVYKARRSEANKSSRMRRKEKIRAYNKEYNQRPEVKERQRFNQRKWRDKNRDELNRKRRERVANNKEKYLNSTRYIKGALVRKTSLEFKDIPPSMVEAYKLHLQLKRKVKNVKAKRI